MRNLKLALCAASALVGSAAYAGPVTLTFEGVGNVASVNDFYNGGTDSQGHSGVNYGINFSSNSLGLIDGAAGGSGNTGNDPSGVTNLIFLDGGAATMNVAAGFDTGLLLADKRPEGRALIVDPPGAVRLDDDEPVGAHLPSARPPRAPN